ncbi:MAG: polyphosphate polymerase domain-containing protein [Oscillospiraceae bacterium]|nr:polyphosphate polymerase domain-containing protein [Oscillospiraceae bacterium]
MNIVLREEKKFLISVADFISLSHRVGQVMLPDDHNGTHGYMIRSLYFDTPFDDDYFEKQAGTELRRKVRLRCYDPNADSAKLELKQKQGVQQLKRSLTVSRADAQQLIAGNYEVLLSYEEPFAAEMYGLMCRRAYRPKTIVEYNRKAFIAKENKIRVTFDNKIVSTESSFDLFAPNLNMNPVLDPYNVVLEVKFNRFLLGYIRELINCTDKSELSVSKYVLARQNGYQTHI